DDAVLVVALLDDGLERARDADAVTAHDGGFARAGFIEEERAEALAVFRAELEDVADFDGAADLERLAALHTRLARRHRPQLPPLGHGDVAFNGDVLEMESVFVRAGGHVVRAAQALVGINGNFLHADRTQTSRMRANGGKD